MTCGYKNAYDCLKAFSETDASKDLKSADISILVCPTDTSLHITHVRRFFHVLLHLQR